MGDRANVKVLGYRKEDAPVYLYTHWRGSDLPFIVKEALSRKQRWDDSAYLARIVFCAMVKGDEETETGFGISAFLCDNEHPIIKLNPMTKEIEFTNEKGDRVFKSWTFDQYIEEDDETIQKEFSVAYGDL